MQRTTLILLFGLVLLVDLCFFTAIFPSSANEEPMGAVKEIEAPLSPPSPSPVKPAEKKRVTPLRLGFLPWEQWSGGSLSWLQNLPETLYQELQKETIGLILTDPARIRQALMNHTSIKEKPQEGAPTPSPPPTPTYFVNHEIKGLSDQLGVDLFLNGSIAQAKDQYWLLIRVMEGASGEVVLQEKLTLEQISQEAVLAKVREMLVRNQEKIERHDGIVDIGTQENLGEVHIRSIPPHITLQWDDQVIGKTPLILRHVIPGKHDFHIWEKEPFSISRVRVSSDPAGIDVLLQGKKVGITPLALPVEALGIGEFKIKFDTKQAFNGTIEVFSIPDGAPVQLDASELQRTPISFTGLKKPEHILKILEKKKVDLYRKIDVSAEQIALVDVDMYKLSKLVVDASEPGVSGYVDQEKVGDLPLSLSISQGVHSLSLRKSRYVTIDQEIELKPGERKELFFKMVSARSVDSSIFLVPTGALTPSLSVTARYLLSSLETSDNPLGELVHSYGIEAYYGWENLYKLYNMFELGFSLGGFFQTLHNTSIFETYQGVGAKLQFLRESPTIPISAAIGSYLHIAGDHSKLVGFMAVSRNFGDFSFAFGIQSHGINVNFGYTGIPKLKVSGIVFIDTLLPFFSNAEHKVTPMYGLNAGYTF